VGTESGERRGPALQSLALPPPNIRLIATDSLNGIRRCIAARVGLNHSGIAFYLLLTFYCRVESGVSAFSRSAFDASYGSMFATEDPPSSLLLIGIGR
jgi:hypothetical protein